MFQADRSCTAVKEFPFELIDACQQAKARGGRSL